MTSPTRADIWKTFSEIKQTKNLQSDTMDGGTAVTFVNWMDTLAEARKHFPQISWEHWTYDNGGEVFYFADKTAEVKATIFIDEVEHSTTLPVTDQNWSPIVNPNANDINTAKKRCLCKALGELGLYWQLWSKVERDGFVQKSTVREAANDSVAANDPVVTPIKPDAVKDVGVDIKQFYNCQYDDQIKKLRSEAKIIATVERIQNNARIKFQGALTDELRDKFNKRVADIKKIELEKIQGAVNGS